MRFLLLLLIPVFGYSQDPDQYIGPKQKVLSTTEKTAACGTPFVSSGYPAWTNYWGGYMINIINTSGTTLNIESFEARFQGNTGYRIYTKQGTFIGFETNTTAWTLVGSIGGGLSGLGTTIPTPIPINVNVCIPIGGTQAFYLTRTNNNAANRHLYVPGTGTPGVTVYASDANLGITEAHYVTPYFAAVYAQARRPSLDVCYTLNCTVLPVELEVFEGVNKGHVNHITWVTATETNNSKFLLYRSRNGSYWEVIAEVEGAGTVNTPSFYEFKDKSFMPGTNYYRLTQVDYDGKSEVFNVISINNTTKYGMPVKAYNLSGQEVPLDYRGYKIFKYD